MNSIFRQNAESTERRKTKNHLKRETKTEERVPGDTKTIENDSVSVSGSGFRVHRSVCVPENETGTKRL